VVVDWEIVPRPSESAQRQWLYDIRTNDLDHQQFEDILGFKTEVLNVESELFVENTGQEKEPTETYKVI
jgi:hypothetical protein